MWTRHTLPDPEPWLSVATEFPLYICLSSLPPSTSFSLHPLHTVGTSKFTVFSDGVHGLECPLSLHTIEREIQATWKALAPRCHDSPVSKMADAWCVCIVNSVLAKTLTISQRWAECSTRLFALLIETHFFLTHHQIAALSHFLKNGGSQAGSWVEGSWLVPWACRFSFLHSRSIYWVLTMCWGVFQAFKEFTAHGLQVSLISPWRDASFQSLFCYKGDFWVKTTKPSCDLTFKPEESKLLALWCPRLFLF